MQISPPKIPPVECFINELESSYASSLTLIVFHCPCCSVAICFLVAFLATNLELWVKNVQLVTPHSIYHLFLSVFGFSLILIVDFGSVFYVLKTAFKNVFSVYLRKKTSLWNNGFEIKTHMSFVILLSIHLIHSWV